MVIFKDNGLSKKEESDIWSLLQEVKDTYSDAYITKENIRLFIKDNVDILFSCLKKGDKISFTADGIAVVVGFSDNAPRKYLKILVKDLEEVNTLVKSLFWNVKEDIYCKVKNNNPLKDKLLRCGLELNASIAKIVRKKIVLTRSNGL